MKIHYNKDGSFDMELTDDDNLDKAAKFVRKLQDQTEGNGEPAPSPLSLNNLLNQAWEWMVDNDDTNGIHFSAFARETGCTEKAANYRFKTLVTMGYAYRVARGRYRAKA